MTATDETRESSTWIRDVEQLKQHKARYGNLVDRCMVEGDAAAQQLALLFSEDAVLDFTQIFGRVFNGRADVIDYFGTTLPQARAWTWHSFTNPIFDIDGDRANVRWLLYAMSSPRDDPQSAPKVSYGHYEDQLLRTSSGWLQTGLTFHNETRTDA